MRKDLQERIEARLNSTEGKFDPLASLTAETIENTELGPVLAALAYAYQLRKEGGSHE